MRRHVRGFLVGVGAGVAGGLVCLVLVHLAGAQLRWWWW
jgi:hypothetical protein